MSLYFGLVCMLASSWASSEACAQNWCPPQNVYQPGFVYAPAQSKVICNSPKCVNPAPAPCNCGCGGSNRCIAHPNCNMCIRSGKHNCKKTTTPIHVDPPSDCDAAIIDKSFYCGDHNSDGDVMVPKMVKCTAEKYRFERKQFEICGCCLEICVPCAIDHETYEKCEPVKTRVPLVAKERTDSGLFDVWAIGVPGYPSQAVLALKITKAEANRRFNASF